MLAITDHDTTRGWDEARAAAPDKLVVLPGAELSCLYGATSVHLLAYGFNAADPVLVPQLQRVRDSRFERGRRMVERIAADGVPISWSDVVADARGGTVGRPHVARALVRAGIVSTVDEAFSSRWLGGGSPYREAKYEPPVADTIASVGAAGGVTVLAHPFAGSRGHTLDAGAVRELAAAGLAGVEVDHPDQRPAERAALRALAAELDLVQTGSSDFHGANKTIELGQELTAPAQYERLVSMIAAATT